MNGTATVGTSTLFSREEHVHPSDTTKQSTAFTPSGNIAASTISGAIAELDTEKLAKAGDTMSGLLTLSGDPDTALKAATKQYVDNSIRAYAAPFAAMDSGMQINGSMEVSQEYGTTGTLIPMLASGSGWGKYIMDGWRVEGNGGGTGSNLVCHSTGPATGITGFAKFLQVYPDNHGFVISSTTENCVVRQFIEGYRISRLAFGTAGAQPVTLAFWINVPVAGQMGITLRNADVSRNITKNVTVAVGWNFRTITFPGCTDGTWDSGNGKGLWIDFCLLTGTSGLATPDVWSSTVGFGSTGQTNFLAAANAPVQLTGVVVLPGTQAPTAAQSPLIMRPYDQELLTCQRYYQKFSDANSFLSVSGYGLAGSQPQFAFPLGVEMRTSPTTAILTGTWSVINASQPGVLLPRARSFGLYLTVTATGTFLANNNAAGAGITFDARL
jgi:hypothetical protein